MRYHITVIYSDIIEIFPELRGLVWLLLQFFIKRSPFRASQEWIYSHMTKVVEERRAKQVPCVNVCMFVGGSDVDPGRGGGVKRVWITM